MYTHFASDILYLKRQKVRAKRNQELNFIKEKSEFDIDLHAKMDKSARRGSLKELFFP